MVTTKLGSSDKRPGTSASPIAMPSCRLYLGELGMALFTLAAASCALFSGASLLTRGGRFFLEAALLQHPHAKAFVDRHLTALVVGALVLLIMWIWFAARVYFGP